MNDEFAFRVKHPLRHLFYRLRAAVAIGITLVLLACLYHHLLLPHQLSGDFRNHAEWGRRLIAKEFLYKDGLNVPYLPAWSLLFAPLSLLPPAVAFVLFSCAGVAALLLLLVVTHHLTQTWEPTSRGSSLLLGLGVVIVCRAFILRDLQDGGPNLVLTGLVWGGIYLWWRGWAGAAGVCVGVATALKCTPLLFVGYFVLKRQWLVVWASLISLVAVSFLPALWQGPSEYYRHVLTWSNQVTSGIMRNDPLWGVLGPEEIKNKALRPVLARFLMAPPTSHGDTVDFNWPLFHLSLSSQAASWVIQAVTVLLLVVIAWNIRHDAVVGRDLSICFDCAVVGLLILLLSPLTWIQHCVGAVPAYYLLSYAILSNRAVPRHYSLLLLVLGVSNLVILNRSLIRPPLATLFEVQGVVTLSLLVLMALCIGCRCHYQRGATKESNNYGPPEDQGRRAGKSDIAENLQTRNLRQGLADEENSEQLFLTPRHERSIVPGS